MYFLSQSSHSLFMYFLVLIKNVFFINNIVF
jgi:hypothetical protein